jgi:hypothetical protein
MFVGSFIERSLNEVIADYEDPGANHRHDPPPQPGDMQGSPNEIIADFEEVGANRCHDPPPHVEMIQH